MCRLISVVSRTARGREAVNFTPSLPKFFEEFGEGETFVEMFRPEDRSNEDVAFLILVVVEVVHGILDEFSSR